jgi:fibronectin-binding autotransporter adhesin
MSLCFALLAAFSLASPLASARADITPSGNVTPSNPSNWSNSTVGIIGNTASGAVTVDRSGHLRSWYSFIGYGSTTTGEVNIAGTGSTWNNVRNLYIGGYGSGTLSITAGGTVSDGTSSGDYDDYIGALGGSGVVNVTGAGSSWTKNTGLHVGFNGHGALSIADGGAVNSGYSYLGNDNTATGVVTVDGAGSTWITSQDFRVGNFGGGTLSISNGGSVTNKGYGYVGYGSTGTGSVAISGASSTWNTVTGLCVGNSGSGTLSVSNGADVANAGAGYIGSSSTGMGNVSVAGTGSNWTNTSSLYVGYSGSGTLSITNGGSVSNNEGYVGTLDGSKGVVAVDGPGSTWVNGSGLYIDGTLAITGGGSVSSGDAVYSSRVQGSVTVSGTGSIWTNRVGIDVGGHNCGTLSITHGGNVTTSGGSVAGFSGDKGIVSVDGQGSIWNNNGGSLHVGAGGTGSLSISRGGAVRSNVGEIGVWNGSAGIVTVADAGSTWTNTAAIHVGGSSAGGTLSVTRGGAVTSVGGDIGLGSGARGVMMVSGAGSVWTNNGDLYVGSSGAGTLSITRGGHVTDTGQVTRLGMYSGATGLATVDGVGSVWTNNDSELRIGIAGGAGIVSITGGGSVTAASVVLDANTSLLAIDVGCGSILTIAEGAGAISSTTSGGKIRVLAGAGVPVDTTKYAPIFAGTWNQSYITYQPIGGTWDKTGHTFTASTVTAGTSSLPVTLNLTSVQRTLIKNNGSGGNDWELGASFPAGATSSMTFTATAANGAVLNILKASAGTDQKVLDAWTFSTTDFTLSTNNPIYFSLKVGPGYSTDDLNLWGYNGTSWSPYTPTDLTYDGAYASFTATGLSGYAVTAVPEPGTLAFLVLGFLGLAAYARRKRKQL